MASRNVTASLLNRELTFTASRSGGPGGQNVNKVNSKITLMFDVVRSEILTPEEKEAVVKRLASHLTKEGVLIVTSQDKRSQLENKDIALQKLDKLLVKAFAKRKIRKPTKPSKTAVQKRITSKKQHGQKKQWRQKPE
jgi:ribosome-associated protein